MTLELRKHLRKESVPSNPDSINRAIIEDDDVQFLLYCPFRLATDWEEECNFVLLEDHGGKPVGENLWLFIGQCMD